MTKVKHKHDFEPRPNPLISVTSAIFQFIGWLLSQAWSGFMWVIRHAFRLISWLAGRMWALFLWVINKPYQILHYMVNGYVPNFDNAREEDVFWRVKRHYRRRTFFLIHLVIFALAILANIVSTIDYWLIAQRNGWEYYPVPNVVLITVWLIILIGHFSWLRLKREEDSALGDAMQREYDRTLQEKQAANRLGDMMIIDEDDEPYYNGKSKRYTERY